jgi:hypothetical protein
MPLVRGKAPVVGDLAGEHDGTTTAGHVLWVRSGGEQLSNTAKSAARMSNEV